MAGVAGSIIGLKVNGSFISCEVSCTFNFTIDLLDSSAIDSGRWKEFIQGIRSWTMTVNGNLLLQAVPSDIKAIITTGLMQGLPVFVEFSTRPSSEIQMILSGAALLQSGSINGPASGSANWTCQFQGTGALKTTFNDYDLLIDALPAESPYPIIVDETGGFTT